MEVVLDTVRLGVCTAGMVTWFEGAGEIDAPWGSVPTADAVFTNDPLSRSAVLTRWVPVHVVDAEGASVAEAQATPNTFGSFTVTAVMVTLPVLVTVNK